MSRRRLAGSDQQHCVLAQNRAELCLQQGKFREAIDGFEQALRLQLRVYGDKSAVVLAKYKAITRELLDSMKMTHAASEPALLASLLLRFEKVLFQFNQSRVVAELCELYNTLSAAYRQMTNFELSRQFLLKALRLANACPEPAVSRASLCLSMCSTLSTAKDFEEARNYGLMGVKYAAEELKQPGRNRAEKVALLAVGHHNVGVQEEKLKRPSLALKHYRKAVEVFEGSGSEEHLGLLANLRKSLADAEIAFRCRPQKRTLPKLNNSARSSPQSSSRMPPTTRADTPDRLRTFRLRRPARLDSFSCLTSADHSYQVSLASTPRPNDSEDDLRELDARGLLDFTQDGEETVRPSTRRVRGRKAKCSVFRAPTPVWSTSSNTPPARPLSPIAAAQQARHAATRIQAFLRGCAARAYTRLLRSQRRKLLYRRGKLFRNGTFGIVAVHLAAALLLVEVARDGRLWVLESDSKASPASLVQRAEFDSTGQLVLVDLHQAAVRIQKVLRGALTRKRLAAEQVRVQCSAHLDGRLVRAKLLRLDTHKLLRLDGEFVANLQVPCDLCDLPIDALVLRLEVKGDTVAFQRKADDTSILKEPLEVPNLSTADTVSPLLATTDTDLEEFRLVQQGVLELRKGQQYTVMCYEGEQHLKVRALPQQPHFLVPSVLLLERSECYPASLLESIRLNSANELEVKLARRREEVLEHSATVIQRCFRKHTAHLKRRGHTFAPGKVLFRGCRALSDETLDQVQIVQNEDRIEVTAKDVGSNSELQLLLGPKDLQELEVTAENIKELFERLYRTQDRLLVAPTVSRENRAALLIQKLIRGVLARFQYRDLMRKTKRKLQFMAQKVVGAEVFHVAVYEYADKIQVETFKIFSQRQLKYRSQSAHFPLTEIVRMYGRVPPVQVIFEDVVLANSVISIRPRMRTEGEVGSALLKRSKPSSAKFSEARSIIRTSQRLGETMWVITMSFSDDGDSLEFSAFSSSAGDPLRVRASLAQLAQKTGMPTVAIFPIGTITIQRLLRISGGQLSIDFNAETPDLGKLATLMQAYVRGFLVRRRIKERPEKSHLITCQVHTVEDQQWVLYAYREPPNIHIRGCRRKSSETVDYWVKETIFRNFPPSISNKRVIENFIFPKLNISTEGEVREFRASKSIQSQSTLLDKHHDKIRVITGSMMRRQSQRSRHSPSFSPAGVRLSPNASPEASFSPGVSPARALLVRRILLKDNLTLQVEPPQEAQSHSRKASQEVAASPRLLLRSGVEIEGKSYLASMFLEKTLLRVQLVDEQSGTTLQKVVAAEGSGVEWEQRCEQLLNKLRVVDTPQGRPEILLQDSPEEILYKRSHYVSNRFFHVTVYRISDGVRIEAFDPTSRRTLVLPLSLCFAPPVQKQLAVLMNRLEVHSLAGNDAGD